MLICCRSWDSGFIPYPWTGRNTGSLDLVDPHIVPGPTLVHWNQHKVQYIPRSMHTVTALLCFVVVTHLTDFPISIRLTSLALGQSNDCPSASKATLMNMDKYFMWIHYERLHNHNKAKHNKTMCIFLGIYCSPISIRLTSLALWQSNDCPSASKATLVNMDKYFMWIHYERLHNHNKAKHNKTVCIFLGIYCLFHKRCSVLLFFVVVLLNSG